MTFKDALERLKKLSDGKYHAMKFEIAEYGHGEGGRTECGLYIEGYNWYEGRTWGEAFDKLEVGMGQKERFTEELPEVSDTEIPTASQVKR